MREQCMNSAWIVFFVPYTINSCDVTIDTLGKKKSKNANVGLETRIQTHT